MANDGEGGARNVISAIVFAVFLAVILAFLLGPERLWDGAIEAPPAARQGRDDTP
jgi:hypothetical protein